MKSGLLCLQVKNSSLERSDAVMKIGIFPLDFRGIAHLAGKRRFLALFLQVPRHFRFPAFNQCTAAKRAIDRR
jgi:hypothetical protein